MKKSIFAAIITRRQLAAILALMTGLIVSPRVSSGAEAALYWYKGIVHAHANWGVPQLPTTSPDVVVRWYREHNYNFVSITDLNYYTPPEGLKAVFDAPNRFLVVPGTELSKDPIQPDNKIVDTIGFGVNGAADLPSSIVKRSPSAAPAACRLRRIPISPTPLLRQTCWLQTRLTGRDSSRFGIPNLE